MTIKGYFNESCSICRAEINHYKKINNSIDWVDVINNKDALKFRSAGCDVIISRASLVKNIPTLVTELIV